MSSSVQKIVLLGGAAILAGFVSVGMAYKDFAGLMIVGLVVVILAGILVPRLLPQTDRRFLLNLAILGFIAKMGGSLTRPSRQSRIVFCSSFRVSSRFPLIPNG